MSLSTRIRRGEGPVWGVLKGMARRVLTFHLPVGPISRPVYGVLYRIHVSGRDAIGWATRFFWYEPLFRSQCSQVGSGLQIERLPYINGRGRLELGDHVRLSGKSSIGFSDRFVSRPEIVIGSHSFVGHDCTIVVARSVRIGSHCLLAGGIRISDFDGHPLDAAKRRQGEPNSPEAVRPVRIGDDVWIGTRAMILKGVTIGDRSVVAASAVVTRDVPSDVVVAGNPARVVKHLGGGDHE